MKRLLIFGLSCIMLFIASGCKGERDASSIPPVKSGGNASNVISGMESGNNSDSLVSGPGNTTVSEVEVNAVPKTQKTESIPPKTGFHSSALEKLDNTKKGYGQGTEVDDKKRPTGAIMLQNKFQKYDALFIAPPESNAIYLTFDEGYENGYTAKILDVLKEKKCTAVFFVTMDYVKKNPDLMKRMIKEGHVIGNHTVTHPSMPTLSIDKAKQEIEGLDQYVQKEFSYKMTLFRPPMGEYSERTLALTQQLGYKTMFWSFAYRDWLTDQQPEKQEAYKKVTQSAHPGAIYLLHAVSSTNTAILGDVIDTFRSQGYTVGAYTQK